MSLRIRHLRLSLPGLTLRTRLTIVYALTFAVGGLIVVAITFFLVGRTSTLADAKAQQVADSIPLDPTCAKAKKQGIAGWTYAGKHPYYFSFTLYPFIGKIGGGRSLANKPV